MRIILLLAPLAAMLHAGWDEVKNAVVPVIGPASEYGTAYRQPCASAGWDDGVHISRDGLHLYCTYVPGDLVSWRLHSSNPYAFVPYLRGSTYSMDLTAGDSSWVHSDILYAARATIADSFMNWQLSGAARPFYTEGAPQTVSDGAGGLEFFVFTSIAGTAAPNYNPDIWWIRGTGADPAGTGLALPAPVNTDSIEDNPHLERLDDTTLVLFFDSSNRPGGPGGLDIWHTQSTDNGTTWAGPQPVMSLCTGRDEEQPHLYRDSTGQWYLYYAAVPADGPEAIYRARQAVPGDWDSWTDPEIIIASDGTFALGEPTLTAAGDISFVVGYMNPDGTDTDRYDVDPWFLPRKQTSGITRTPATLQNMPAMRRMYTLSGRELTGTRGPGIVIVREGHKGWHKELRIR